MAVLVEAITVVLKRDAVDAKFPGGWEAFQQQAPYLACRDTLVTDGELVAVLATRLVRRVARARRRRAGNLGGGRGGIDAR